MRAHIITTDARTIVPGGILALSLAVVLLAATASTASAERYIVPTVALTGNGVTAPTPPALPLQFSVDLLGRVPAPNAGGQVRLEKKLEFRATASSDSTLVATGAGGLGQTPWRHDNVKKTTKELAANEETEINVKLKHLKRLRESRTRPHAKVKFAATDEFGQTATDGVLFWFCRTEWRPGRNGRPCWRPR